MAHEIKQRRWPSEILFCTGFALRIGLQHDVLGWKCKVLCRTGWAEVILSRKKKSRPVLVSICKNGPWVGNVKSPMPHNFLYI